MKDLQARQQTLINLITRVGGRQNIQKWMDELLKIDVELEAGDKKMTKSLQYKGFKLTANAVSYKGKKLPEERWSLSRGLGVIFLAEGGNDFNPVLDLSHVKLTSEEEKEYQQKLVVQHKIEQSFAANEWRFKRSTSVEQDIYGNRVTAYDRWEHPTYGIVEGEQWRVPSQYSADNWKNLVLLGRKSAESRRLIFEAWVNYWEKVDSQPKKDPMADANAVVKQLEDMGVFPESIVIVDAHQITVKGADAQTHGGKEYYFDADVWFSKSGLKIADTQVQASRRALYAEYKKGLGNRPAKSYQKWLETKGATTTKTVTTNIVVDPKKIEKGCKVIHRQWGNGEVIMVMSSTTCSVRFAGVGNKMVDPSALSLA